jgi:hypothetical protein
MTMTNNNNFTCCLMSAGHIACTLLMKNAKKVLVRKTERKKPFKKPTCKLGACIKTDLK